MSIVPDDIKERRLALDIERSYCVQAPAGSGKTELLTQRYLSLLANCDRPEEVLSITFTRKAAAEMRNRILDNMSRAAVISDDELASLSDNERFTLTLAQQVLAKNDLNNWQLTENTSRLRISTIDSFNAFLTGQLPVISELGVMPEVVDDAGTLYEEAVIDLLSELDHNSTLSTDIGNVLVHVNNQWRTLTTLLTGLLAKRDQWLGNILDIQKRPQDARAILEGTLNSLVTQNLDALARKLSPYLADLLPLLHFAAGNLEQAGDTALAQCDIEEGLPPCNPDYFQQWQLILKLLLTNDHIPRKLMDKRSGFPAPNDADSKADKALRKEMKERMLALLAAMREDVGLLEAFEEFRYLPDATFSDSQWQVMESLTALLPALVSRLAVVFSKYGKADHVQISIAALSALGQDDQPTDLALRLDYQLKHILVDEFQDTSTLQISLLEKLTYGWQPDDGRTLFIVGDGMQSCYGFRNANVGLFLAARDNGIGTVNLKSLQLTTNFRSQAGIVDWVNSWFAPAFPEEDDIGRGGVRDAPPHGIHEEIPALGVNTILFTADSEMEDAKFHSRKQEASLVAERIQALVSAHPGDSIALLVRTRGHLLDIIPALRAQGVRWNAAEIDPLNSYSVVQDLLMLTRALLNIADVTAWLAMLRSPWFGLQVTDIHHLSLASQQNSCSLWQSLQAYQHVSALSDDAATILARTLPILCAARNQRRRLPLREWLEKTWTLLGGPATLQGAHYMESVQHYFSLLQEFDECGDIPDIHRFEAKVNSRFADGIDPEAPLQVMTIHKAKGLEFDHVIIPGLERPPRPDDSPLLLWREHISAAGSQELVMSMPAQRGQDRDPTYQHLKYEASQQQRLETTRLFYIAVTRAIKSALLLGGITRDGDVFKGPDRNAMLAALWPMISAAPENMATLVPVMESTETQSPNTSTRFLSRRLPPSWTSPLQHEQHGREELERRFDVSHEWPENEHDNLLQRRIGDIIHECLQQAGDGQLDLANREALTVLESHWRTRLASLAENMDDVIANIHKQLEQCCQHERYHWMLLEQQAGAACELSLSDYRKGRRRQAIVDRTFIDKDGTRWIIDYKSSTPTGNMDTNAFLEAQAARYRDQLAGYASLFRAMEESAEPRPVRAALFFTALPCFHEVPLDASPPAERTPLFDE